ncbi:restriction endonuclease subunit S [Thermococcus sp. 21S7]|uniref:restriction endonuclease subunit S n=1 Tax=Thermococcus sp. 21S7 TaxID=1638221 RepID=UPI00143A219C|nr:restriction endonuclease subunit S [Thermococcus sp. 21S7]NJE61460.1 hypothetical protein [Thermococcus sp. 21S7]
MKTAKHQGRYYNIEYSIVNISELEGELRIDAEYYDPFYLKNEKIITKKKWCRIGDLVSKVQYGLSLAMNEEKVGYKILKMDDIIGILADDSNCKYVEIDSKTFQKFKLEKGDILFNRVNSEEFVGRTGIYLLDGDHTFASYLIIVRAKNYFTNFYITVYLNTKYGRISLRRVMRRAVNQANINAEELKSLKIPVPSNTFQKFIEKLVITAYEERKRAEQLYRQAEHILLNELSLKNWKPKTKKIKIDGKDFEEEENISIRMLSDVTKKDRMDAEYWDPKYDEIEDVIKNYKNGWGYLPHLVEISKKKIKVNKGGTYDYIELADINPNLGVVKQTKQISGEDLPSRARMEVKKGYVIMSSVEGSIDKIALIHFDKNNLVASTGFFVFKEKEINKETLLVLLKVLSKIYLVREAQGTILTAIPYDSLNRIVIPKVCPQVQQKISQLIQQSFKAWENSKKRLEIAKRTVELYIEYNEKVALEYLKYSLFFSQLLPPLNT